jgi:lipoate-protein ligase A
LDPSNLQIEKKRRKTWQPISRRENIVDVNIVSGESVTREQRGGIVKHRSFSWSLELKKSLKRSVSVSKLSNPYSKMSPEYLASIKESKESSESSIREIFPLLEEAPSSPLIDISTESPKPSVC